MGTRSKITFVKKIGDTENPLVSIYQQFDGYLDGVGKELAEWIINKRILNGIGINQRSDNYCNGVGCLAAQYIRDFKPIIGNLYIVPTNDDESKYDYVYTVVIDELFDLIPEDGVPLNDRTKFIAEYGYGETIFTGSPKEFVAFISKM